MKRLLLGLFLIPVPLVAQDAPSMPADWVKNFQWRSIGPANMGGRIVELAVYEKDPTMFWAATASGGLLKTTNNGITFEHQFDKETTVSIGSVCVSQSNPNIVWVGTGEENPRNSVSYGDGVYKSVDGGKTWKNMGLKKTFQIGCIQVHPTNPDIVYVGALGRLYGPNEDRGLFKTTDGGKTWSKIHYVDDKTGVIDIQMKPKEPDTLIFATYERQRDGFDGNAPAKKIAPGSGLWRTTDGGQTFEKLTKGLPTCNMGRIGIDFYRRDPNMVYAIIETEMMGKPPVGIGWSGIQTVEDADAGVKIVRMSEDGPAAKAGLKVNDIVLRLNDNTVLKGSQFAKTLLNFEPGDKVRVEYARSSESAKVEIELIKRPARGRGGRGAGRGGRGARGGRGGRGGRGFGGRGRGGRGGGARVTNLEQSAGGRLGGQAANVQDLQGKRGYEHGGVFVSEDCGSTWKRINSIDPRPMYFSQFRVDPYDNKYQYVLGISGSRSKDSGKTFTSNFTRGVHADHHALWVNPENGRHMILGCDGGIYVTYDRGDRWDHLNHAALGQFYHVAVGPRRNYWVYGGLQDNGTWGGPHRSDQGGIINEDWIRIGGGDGFVVRVDPNDPDQIYYESQNGATQRRNLRTGEGGRIRPGTGNRGGQRGGGRGGQRGGGRGGQRGGGRGGRGGGRRYRYNWKTPFILSHHNSKIYYNAGNYVFKSLNKGNNLKAISPEITRTNRGSGTAIAESPINPDVLYVGTDDGALWGTRHGTREWVNLGELGSKAIIEASTKKEEKKDGGPSIRETNDGPVPFREIVKKPMWISSIEASRYVEGRVYVTVDGHRSDDDGPYVLVSEDFGHTWTSLNNNLPRGSTRAVREDRVNRDLLYLGTEFGFYVSLNRGKEWTRFHNNLPTVAIHDIAQHQSCGDIVLGTHGRSFWAIDISPLRSLTRRAMRKDVVVCKPDDVILWKRGQSRGSSGGARRYSASNPPTGAQIFFVLNKKPQTLSVTVHDAGGTKIRDLTQSVLGTGENRKQPTAGLHKVSWRLDRDPRPRTGQGAQGGQGGQMSREEMIRRFRQGGGRGGRGRRGRGGFGRGGVGVGTYTVKVTADGETVEATFKVSPDPRS